MASFLVVMVWYLSTWTTLLAESPVPSDLKQSFVHCFENTAEHVLAFKMEEASSVGRCIYICKQKGFHFAGAHHDKSCYCGNELKIDKDKVEIPDADCNIEKCNIDELCGSADRFAVFKTGQKFTFHRKKQSYADAKKTCEDRGQQLATFDTYLEMKHVIEMIMGGPNWNPKENVWIGLYRRTNGERQWGDLYWTDGTKPAFENKIKWDKEGSDHGCFALNTTNAYWIERKCTDSLMFVCEQGEALECRRTQLGLEYRGKINKTKTGIDCQYWSTNKPHVSHFPHPSKDAKNYCRNPDKEPGGPWCYTTDPNKRWEYCEIPDCVKKDYCDKIDCQNEGHCISNNDGFVCKCTTHYYGKYCEKERPCYYERPLGRGCNPAKLDKSKSEVVQKVEITEKECIKKCMNSQKVNGVECWAAAHLPGCSCPDCWLFYSQSPKYCVENEDSFSGVTLFIKNCSKVDHCLNNPCKDRGQCVNEKEDYECECIAGFTGKSCQDVDHCHNNPCKDRGPCENEKEDYECKCIAGFTGKSCQDVDHCHNNPCKDRGRCENEKEDYECKCTAGFTGKSCQDVDHCHNNPCKDRGRCENEKEDYECKCIAGFTGKSCQDVDHCHNNPCKDRGRCENEKEDYECKCIAGFTGKSCQDVDHCHNNPCKDRGRCENEKEDYECKCTAGFTGKSCQDVDHCHNNPCKDRGRCENEKEDYECKCIAGFTGKSCQDVDHCHNNPCKDRGRCENEKEDYECKCIAGFTGKSCQDVDHCHNNPCKDRGRCENEKEDYECKCTAGFTGKSCQDVDHCHNNPCKDRGRCENEKEDYECKCIAGFTGKSCQDVDHCRNNPCKNGGQCVNEKEDYKCECTAGFTGKSCQDVDHCRNNPCKNGGQCVNEKEDYECKCTAGFTGKSCQDVDYCHGIQCKNEGKCVNGKDNFHCECTTEFTGKLCESAKCEDMKCTLDCQFGSIQDENGCDTCNCKKAEWTCGRGHTKDECEAVGDVYTGGKIDNYPGCLSYCSCCKKLGLPDHCLMKKEPGPCKTAFTKWYYNSESKKCEKFTFSGCGGNKNQFSTEKDCYSSCSPIKKVIVCEYTNSTLECNKGEVIEIVYAFYGRKDTKICKFTLLDQVTDCTADNAGDILRKLCDNKTSCEVKASNTEFGDPCQNTYKYLEIDYQCKKKPCPQIMCLAHCQFGTITDGNGCDTCNCKTANPCRTKRCAAHCPFGTILDGNGCDTCKCKTGLPEHCLMKKEPGLCKAALPKWYYNSESKKCEKFTFGGCGGNKNQFSTEKDCYSSCTLECRRTQLGLEYRGKINKTKTGIDCQYWSADKPHFSNFHHPSKDAKNYCRNPDKELGGPWCYTTDLKKRWEHCEIPDCDCGIDIICDGSEGKCRECNDDCPDVDDKDCCDGKQILIQTPNEMKYQFLWFLSEQTSQKFITFKVKACKDVHIALVDGTDIKDILYEIMIGGWENSKSVIRKEQQGRHLAELQESDLLNCNEYTQVWISWKDKTILVVLGTKEERRKEILKLLNVDVKDISAVAIYTAFGAKGKWIFCTDESTIDECKMDKIGTSYKGTKNITKNRNKCQAWGSQKPHKHDYGYLKDQKNYCRNPDNFPGGLWCYTEDPEIRWELCNVPYCFHKSCEDYKFDCGDRQCIDEKLECDGTKDCRNNEDEAYCDNKHCPETEFECDVGICIPNDLKCNGHPDCLYGKDEQVCDYEYFGCFQDDKDRLLDGEMHWKFKMTLEICQDLCKGFKYFGMEVGHECHCGNSLKSREKYPKKEDCNWRCSGNYRQKCGGPWRISVYENDKKCEDGKFECGNGQCVDKTLKCDGKKQCSNGADEEECDDKKCEDGKFECGNGQCVDKTLKCDGKKQCSNGADEEECDDKKCEDGKFECRIGECVDKTLKCDGKKQCSNGADEEECDDKKCEDGKFECRIGECVDKTLKCDGKKQCSTGADEEECGFVYIGCFYNLTLDGNRTKGTEMTVQKCQTFCKKYDFFYLENQYYCHCGNSTDHKPDENKRKEVKYCTTPCAGNQLQMCGGQWRYRSLYKNTLRPCRRKRCAADCPFGTILDGNGCDTCKCKTEKPCPQIRCAVHCQFGRIQDENGCDICKCRTDRTCKSLGCKNGGECFNKNGIYVCDCPKDTSGQFCETDKRETCKTRACENGGLCIHRLFGLHECKCPIDTFGKFCETGYVYVGCYSDDSDRMLEILKKWDDNHMTVQKCAYYCKGFKLFGLQNSNECHCGNTNRKPEVYRKKLEKECMKPCVGNRSQTCGGPWRISLYKYTDSSKNSETKPEQAESLMKAIVCEDTKSYLRCHDEDVIEIKYAFYGRKDAKLCFKLHSSNWDLNCTTKKGPLPVVHVRSQCNGKTFCEVSASNALFNDDPCPYTYKYLEVGYWCKEKNCKKNQLGLGYRGTLSTTKQGRTCQAWSSQTPHRHGFQQDLLKLDLDKNYCRNPDKSQGGPWCYTTVEKPHWEYCDVPYCGSNKNSDGNTKQDQEDSNKNSGGNDNNDQADSNKNSNGNSKQDQTGSDKQSDGFKMPDPVSNFMDSLSGDGSKTPAISFLCWLLCLVGAVFALG